MKEEFVLVDDSLELDEEFDEDDFEFDEIFDDDEVQMYFDFCKRNGYIN